MRRFVSAGFSAGDGVDPFTITMDGSPSVGCSGADTDSSDIDDSGIGGSVGIDTSGSEISVKRFPPVWPSPIARCGRQSMDPLSSGGVNNAKSPRPAPAETSALCAPACDPPRAPPDPPGPSFFPPARNRKLASLPPENMIFERPTSGVAGSVNPINVCPINLFLVGIGRLLKAACLSRSAIETGGSSNRKFDFGESLFLPTVVDMDSIRFCIVAMVGGVVGRGLEFRTIFPANSAAGLRFPDPDRSWPHGNPTPDIDVRLLEMTTEVEKTSVVVVAVDSEWDRVNISIVGVVAP